MVRVGRGVMVCGHRHGHDAQSRGGRLRGPAHPHVPDYTRPSCPDRPEVRELQDLAKSGDSPTTRIRPVHGNRKVYPTPSCAWSWPNCSPPALARVELSTWTRLGRVWRIHSLTTVRGIVWTVLALCPPRPRLLCRPRGKPTSSSAASHRAQRDLKLIQSRGTPRPRDSKGGDNSSPSAARDGRGRDEAAACPDGLCFNRDDAGTCRRPKACHRYHALKAESTPSSNASGPRDGPGPKLKQCHRAWAVPTAAAANTRMSGASSPQAGPLRRLHRDARRRTTVRRSSCSARAQGKHARKLIPLPWHQFLAARGRPQFDTKGYVFALASRSTPAVSGKRYDLFPPTPRFRLLRPKGLERKKPPGRNSKLDKASSARGQGRAANLHSVDVPSSADLHAHRTGTLDEVPRSCPALRDRRATAASRAARLHARTCRWATHRSETATTSVARASTSSFFRTSIASARSGRTTAYCNSTRR